MEPILPSRPLTFRVENIQPGTTAEELKKLFYTEDQPHLRVKSLVPAVDNYELDIRDYTATVTFQAQNRTTLSPRLLDEDVSIDSDFHGFTPLNHPQEPIAADIIAVTGLAAHAFGSWAHSAQNMWLRDYLPRDVSNVRVLIYGYPSQLYGSISRSILSDHSTNMIHRLLAMRESAKCQSRPIVFIGHSLGCLIIKKALCDINGSVGIYSSRLPVRSIIFLGAPHKGLETTALETLVKSQASEDMIRELKSESPTLTELNDKFRHVAKDIDILTCYELSPTKTAIEMPDGTWKREGPPIMMVSQDSAKQWYPREELLACNADHSQIAKLKRGENSIYPSVRWAIKKALLSAGDLYSDSKEIHHDESHHLGSVDEASALRRSLLQVTHRQSSKVPNDRSIDQAPTPSRSPSADATDQQIRRLHQVDIDQSTPGSDTQSRSDPLDKTVSQWQSGIDIRKMDETRSPASPENSVETNMAPVLFDEDGSTSKGTELTASLLAEATASEEANEGTDLDPPKLGIQIDEPTVPQKEDLNIATNGVKSMVMDKRMECTIILGDEAKTRDLLAHSYDVDCKGDGGLTPLLLAARYRHENIVNMLLELGASRGAKCDLGRTTLHWLAMSPEIPLSESLVDLLLKDRPPLYVSDLKNDTPLHHACRVGELLLATKIIRHGANVHACNLHGSTPLHCAAYYGKAQLIPLLLANGAELEVKTKQVFEVKNECTPLHLAAASPSDASDTVEELLRAGADKEAKTSWQMTPLLLAVGNHNKACVASLLQAAANVEAKNCYDDRPLHVAAREGQLEITKALLHHAADPNAAGGIGMTSLHFAANEGQLEIIKALLDHGANPTLKDSRFFGDKPSRFAMKQEIKDLLREAEKAWKKSGKK